MLGTDTDSRWSSLFHCSVHLLFLCPCEQPFKRPREIRERWALSPEHKRIQYSSSCTVLHDGFHLLFETHSCCELPIGVKHGIHATITLLGQPLLLTSCHYTYPSPRLIHIWRSILACTDTEPTLASRLGLWKGQARLVLPLSSIRSTDCDASPLRDPNSLSGCPDYSVRYGHATSSTLAPYQAVGPEIL